MNPNDPIPKASPGISTDALWKLMERVEGSITGVNSKASILFYLNGFLLTNLAFQWPRYSTALQGTGPNAHWTIAAAVLAMLVAVSGIMTSLWASYSAILPGNVGGHRSDGPSSLVFFAHIADRTVDEYRAALEACTETELRADLQRQIHSLAVIVHAKQKRMRLAVHSAMNLSIPGLVVLLALYLLRAR